MSNGYRNGAFALGLVVGGGLVLNLFLWLDYQANTKCQQNGAKCQEQSNSQIGTIWDGFIGTFISPSDTLAQWVMAFFTIAATGILVLTLRSANKTNIAAVAAANAATDSNAIMRNEQRPWVILHRDVNCDFHDVGHGGKITWNYNFENKGRGPAYDVKLDFTFIKRAHFQHMTLQLDGFLQDVLSKRRLSTLAVLFPGESTNFVHYQARGMTRYQEDGFSVQPVSNEGHIMMMACLTYRLAHNSDDFGYDVRMFGIEESKQWIGPWGHTMLEHASARLIG